MVGDDPLLLDRHTARLPHGFWIPRRSAGSSRALGRSRSAAEKPMVCGLSAGGRRIRTIGPAHRILRYLSKKDESPKVQPEAVAAGFEDKRNPRDIAAGSDRLIRLGAGEVS